MTGRQVSLAQYQEEESEVELEQAAEEENEKIIQEELQRHPDLMQNSV